MEPKKFSKGGNPNLTKGRNNPNPTGARNGSGKVEKGFKNIVNMKAGYGPAALIVRVPQCAKFMEEEGWQLLMNVGRAHGAKNQVAALNTLAAYGFGKPTESMDITSGGKSLSVADFLSGKHEKDGGDAAGGSGGD